MKLVTGRNDVANRRSGMFVGGIGAGGFEVRADGKFFKPYIFNDWRTENPFDAFFLHRDPKTNTTRILWLEDVITSGKVVRGVSRVEYESDFPTVRLSFPEVRVTIEFSSFFVPGDLKNSTLPAVRFRVKGEGVLALVVRAPTVSKPSIRDHHASIRSREGEIGILSLAGQALCYPNSFSIINHFDSVHRFHKHLSKYPESMRSADSSAVMMWEGAYDDEGFIAWHYPAMKDLEGNLVGHWYARNFRNYQALAGYLTKNRQDLVRRTLEFGRSIATARVPGYLKESYQVQLSALVKQSWLTRNFEFGVWEGSACCCGLQTTDVAYYGSWLYLTMFPELDKAGLRELARFQRPDGWIPHFFPGTFKRIDEYRRKDMNMQWVMMVWRDYAVLRDPAFLKEMYPKIRKAIDGVYAWDTDKDGVPDIEGPDQTFDQWGWKGCSTYLAGLWLAALRIGMECAKIFGDAKSGRRWTETFEKVKDTMIRRLWNGRWFILWTTETERDEGCLIDGLSGDWYCLATGLGHILPASMVKSHLRWTVKLTRKKMDLTYMRAYSSPGESGWCYANGGYPEGDKRVHYQQYEPWTGMEYALAYQLWLNGMTGAALRVVKDVFERKRRSGMTWNHIECGGDYYRALMIGALWDGMTKVKSGVEGQKSGI